MHLMHELRNVQLSFMILRILKCFVSIRIQVPFDSKRKRNESGFRGATCNFKSFMIQDSVQF